MTRQVGRLLVLFATLAPLACVLWPEGTGPGASAMPPAEALERIGRGEAVLIDVRSPEEYTAGHVPGALNIAASEIQGRAFAIRKMDRLPILYCG
jgi:3-mercaptopyruvate sulfurtransferase SseA